MLLPLDSLTTLSPVLITSHALQLDALCLRSWTKLWQLYTVDNAPVPTPDRKQRH
jgi:hypothetical protein